MVPGQLAVLGLTVADAWSEEKSYEVETRMISLSGSLGISRELPSDGES